MRTCTSLLSRGRARQHAEPAEHVRARAQPHAVLMRLCISAPFEWVLGGNEQHCCKGVSGGQGSEAHSPSSCAFSTDPMSLLVAVESVSELSPLAAVAAAAAAPPAASPVLAADLLSRPSRKLMSLLLRLLLCVREGFLSRSSAYV